MKAINYVLAIFMVLIVGVILNGYTLSILWGWFAVNAFGLPELGVINAMGIAIMINFLVSRPEKTSDAKNIPSVIAIALGSAAAKCAIALSAGWVLMQFI